MNFPLAGSAKLSLPIERKVHEYRARVAGAREGAREFQGVRMLQNERERRVILQRVGDRKEERHGV